MALRKAPDPAQSDPRVDLIHEHLLLISPVYAAAWAAQEDAAESAWSNGPVEP